MKLENERLYVEIAELGAEVTRIYDKKKGNELLWEGDPAYWKRHSPVLFPNVGKTCRNTVRIRENSIRLPSTGSPGIIRSDASARKRIRPRFCLPQMRRPGKYIPSILS